MQVVQITHVVQMENVMKLEKSVLHVPAIMDGLGRGVKNRQVGQIFTHHRHILKQ